LTRGSAGKLIDQFLLAYTIGDASKRTKFLSETRLQKLAFISEKEMTKDCEKGFNYYFIKLYHGPFSQSLRNDLKSFVQSKIVETEKAEVGVKIVPTQKCLSLFQDFGALSLRNRDFLKRITEVNRRYAPMEFEKLLSSIYRMRTHLGTSLQTVGRSRMRAPLLKPIPEENARKLFILTQDEIATLEIYLDRTAFDSLKHTMNSLRTKPLLRFDEVF
jgi:uncharacterized phage-associated protein